MCGFAGVISDQIDQAEFKRRLDKVHYRGPDHTGIDQRMDGYLAIIVFPFLIWMPVLTNRSTRTMVDIHSSSMVKFITTRKSRRGLSRRVTNFARNQTRKLCCIVTTNGRRKASLCFMVCLLLRSSIALNKK